MKVLEDLRKRQGKYNLTEGTTPILFNPEQVKHQNECSRKMYK